VVSRRDLACREFTELVTDLLEGALDDATLRRVDDHLADCAGCRRALAQWKAVVRLAGALNDDDVAAVPEPTRQRLLEAFRAARAAPDGP